MASKEALNITIQSQAETIANLRSTLAIRQAMENSMRKTISGLQRKLSRIRKPWHKRLALRLRSLLNRRRRK